MISDGVVSKHPVTGILISESATSRTGKDGYRKTGAAGKYPHQWLIMSKITLTTPRRSTGSKPFHESLPLKRFAKSKLFRITKAEQAALDERPLKIIPPVNNVIVTLRIASKTGVEVVEVPGCMKSGKLAAYVGPVLYRFEHSIWNGKGELKYVIPRYWTCLNTPDNESVTITGITCQDG